MGFQKHAVRWGGALVVGLLATGSVLADDGAMSAWEHARSEAPPPYGIGLNFYHQEQAYAMDRFRIDVLADDVPVLGGLDLDNLDLADLEGLEIDNEVWEMNLKADVWVLPMVNLFGIVGYVDGKTEVDVHVIDKLKIEYEGIVYGVGGTVAGGWKDVFVTLTGMLTETDLDTSDSAVKAWIFSPKIGYKGKYGKFWAGAMYQETEEAHEGTIDVSPLGRVAYDVTLKQDAPWNYLIGYAGSLCDCVHFDFEAGFGDRTHGSVSVGYRF